MALHTSTFYSHRALPVRETLTAQEDSRPFSFSAAERDSLDVLLGAALLDSDVRQRLVVRRDTTLFNSYAISQRVQRWLKALQATSVAEIAQAVAYHA